MGPRQPDTRTQPATAVRAGRRRHVYQPHRPRRPRFARRHDATPADQHQRTELGSGGGGLLPSCPGDRDWWCVAYDQQNTIIGIAIPSATPTNRNVGYLAVLPEHRGHGYVDDLLGFITAFHASAGAPRITATTDAVNTPMAAAFERAGYRCTEVRIDLEP
ncbi:GNAT family N-acetyltransferase [Rothia endophytica]|uniref:GNAT family N-acetyltransferase n=1 Tax=Rothia endophytica TaxID=1324766 RepID=UPI0031EC6175